MRVTNMGACSRQPKTVPLGNFLRTNSLDELRN